MSAEDWTPMTMTRGPRLSSTRLLALWRCDELFCFLKLPLPAFSNQKLRTRTLASVYFIYGRYWTGMGSKEDIVIAQFVLSFKERF